MTSERATFLVPGSLGTWTSGCLATFLPNYMLTEINSACDFIQTSYVCTVVQVPEDENSVTEKFPASESPLKDLRVFRTDITGIRVGWYRIIPGQIG